MNEAATPTLRDIEAAVCARFGLTPEILRGPKKHRGIARPRQIVMFLAREMTPLSYSRIGVHFNRDHTTVLFAQRRIRELIEKNQAGRVCEGMPRLGEAVGEGTGAGDVGAAAGDGDAAVNGYFAVRNWEEF